jgi:Rrf2 family protein
MRITFKTEYACIAMLELAASYDDPGPVRIKTIAEAQSIDARFLVQILLQLKTAGLVTSVRGAAGGYRLARAPEAITLAQIINAVADPSVAPTSTPSRSTRRKRLLSAAVEKRTPAAEVLLDVWQEVQAQEQRLLEQLTLAELLRRSQSDNALVYQI